ncbi:MAG: hypothetical protein ACXWLI_07310 [Myxococcaceae bacterium]
MSRWAVLAAVVLSLAARAQRPDEDALFGGTPDAGTPAPPPSAAVRPGGAPDTGAGPGLLRGPAQESRGLDTAPSSDAFAAGRVQEDPLRIGGLFYTRLFLTTLQNQPFNQSTVSFPTLVDVYLDARPMDRLRAFVLGRLTYDPFFAVTVGGTALPGVPASTTVSNPAVVLDQAWLAFDIGHAVFLTVGRQHVKWGVARFFTPTDFLASQPRDPLALFDSRLGVTMIRAQIPWERAGWNFTAIALFEPTQLVGGGYSGSAAVENPGSSGINPTGSTGTEFRDIGGALRAEFAFKNGAVGLDGLVQRNRSPRAGADVTMSLGDFDIYGEVAWKQYSDAPSSRTFDVTTQVDLSGQTIPGNPPIVLPPGTFLPVTSQVSVAIAPRSRPVVQAAGGVTYSLNFEGNKSLTFGAEYFYNSASYARTEYLGLLLVRGFQPFYVGEHYLALSATLLDTTAKTTWVLSGIGNLSDASYVARLDFVVTVLSYLSVEAYVAGHFGQTGGELRLGFPQTTLGPPLVTGLPPGTPFVFGPVNPPVVDVGVGLRLSI